MNIKIKSITLRNFKGLRDVSFDFDGRNATIIGDNGTGKTTIFDALTWVLFGKDSHNSTDIDIKTIDATGEPMHRAEHFVEVALDVDGSAQTLRRTYREIWSKPRGSSDLRFVGHESAFAVNGVEVGTKAAYDKIISEWINDNVFRMLTDPMYFNTRVDWKGRRAALLALVGDNIDRTAIQAQFADLLAEMNGEPLADFKARLATEKRKNKKELETFGPKIEAYQNTMPPAEDYAALEQEITQRESVAANEIAAYQRQIDALDTQIADASKIDEETQAAHDRRLKKVLDIKKSLSDHIDARLTAARRYNSDRDAAIMDAQAKADSILREIEKTETTANSKRDTLEACVKKQANIKSALDSMRAKYEAEKKAAFEYVDATTCYACGQPLPAATIEEARRAARERLREAPARNTRQVDRRRQSRKGYLQQVNKAGFDHRTGNRNARSTPIATARGTSRCDAGYHNRERRSRNRPRNGGRTGEIIFRIPEALRRAYPRANRPRSLGNHENHGRYAHGTPPGYIRTDRHCASEPRNRNHRPAPSPCQ
ncbi:MAG: AAA family ATPase [Alistipes finegoldii]